MNHRTPPGPSPERDRLLAAKPRYAPRRPVALGSVVSELMRSEEIQRLRRFQRINGALRSALSASQLAKITPIQLKGGVLTIDVSDGPLLAELRQHHAQQLLTALAAAGTGVSRVQLRLAQTRLKTRR
jgi:hypothetical protein